ncbi:hypothetical protein [Streptomyces sp. XH2]|uniref:hypothetical protein n=1 Tax=Streptomyces sp. XH2 TaxID=3412483 RepID=UPI003C7A73A5
MILEWCPHYLRWDEVDPARHPFDCASAAQAVHSLGPARRGAWSRGEAQLWADATSYAPWPESLAGWFEAYPLDLAAVEDQQILWERAARNLTLQVVDRTGCGSGWYGHCRQVLTWFLGRWGVAPGRDGAAEDIRAFDGALDPARAEALLAALEPGRADAARGRLVRLRAAPRPAATRPDHARSAFLALVFVLAREGVALNSVGLLRRVTFRADDPQDVPALVRYIGIYLAQTRRGASSCVPGAEKPSLSG